MSTSKFANANYITIFDKEAVNIYDANETTITVTRGAILCGFKCPMTGMWRIPLVDLVRNNNTDTVIVNCPSPVAMKKIAVRTMDGSWPRVL